MPRLYGKNVFDFTTLEILLASFVVETCCFSALYVCKGEFATILFFIFKEVLNLGV